MGDIVVGIGTKVLECLVRPILDQARYLFCFKQFIKELEEAKDELKRRLDEVKEREEQVAIRNSEEIMLPVKNWLNDVEKILEDVHELQRKVAGEGKSCFNVSHRFSLAKQMDKKVKRMMKLKMDSHFDHFSRITQIPGISYYSSKGFVDFNSRKSTSNHLLEAIKDGKKTIGLYGMGGSGKTTLSKEVGKQVKDLKLFKKVVLVVVSKPLNVAKLQQELAEQIGLKFQDETQSIRAQRLSERLKNEKILIILDDVWEYLSLEDIGIPLVEGCRILLTTRLRNLCVSMDCETIVELPLITNEEAWELFKKHANLYNDPSNKFDDVGWKIVDECKELPIAIVVLGSSLKGKPIKVWESALWRLKNFQPLNVEQSFRSPYACLELSYDNLPCSTAKSLFLLCSMFLEDHEIHKEDLFRFGKGTLQLEESINTMEDARREILVALNVLLDSCLLIRIDKQACVKMHDLVRDVALWIAKKQNQAILVDSHVVSNMLVSNRQSLKDKKKLSLWNLDENFKLSNQLHCSTPDILLLQPHGLIEDFAGINALKVLALITYSFKWNFLWDATLDCLLPRSIVSLTNLHTLCLRGKRLGDISFLGELKGLEVLDLRGSLFNDLPAEIVDMKMLKLLDVFGCEIEKNYLEVIGRCEQLEELYLSDNKSTIPENFCLSRLKRYVILECHIFNDFHSEYYFPDYMDSLDGGNEEMRALWIQGFKVSTLNLSMQDLIHRANFLYLDDCRWDHKHINLFEINHLLVYRCQEKRFIIDNLDVDILQTQKVFSNLITLRLVNMNNLELVFKDSCISYSLPMLQELFIRNCPQLRTYIFTHAMITKTPKLRRLEIDGCKKVKWLFSYSLTSHCPSLEEILINECSKFERLIDEETAHGDPLLNDLQNYPYQPLILFPKLKEITIADCNKVRWLLPYSLASHCPSLQKLYISSCSELERLVDGKSDEEVAYGNQLLLKMKKLSLHYLLKLREVFVYEYKLESLRDKQESPQHKLVKARAEEKVLDKQLDRKKNQKHENERLRVVNSELCYIWLQGLLELECIWKGPTQIVSLHRLEHVRLWECPRLRNIFTLATVTSLPELKTLEINACNEWEGIFCEESLKNLYATTICFPKLETIEIYACQKLRSLFSYSLASHCPLLKQIIISSCSQLEGVVQAYEGEVASYDGKLFPRLKYLHFEKLPKLRDIYIGYEFDHLSSTVVIEDCPTYAMSH